MTDEPGGYMVPRRMPVALLSSIYEETPEGLYRMDRIRRWEEQHRREMTALIGPRHDEIEQQMSDAFIRGTS